MAVFPDAMSIADTMGPASCSLRICVLIMLTIGSSASAPKIVTVKPLDDVELGQRVNMVCSLKEGTPPISFSWRKDGALIEQNSELRVLHTDEYQETLQITKVSPTHTGNYTCSVKNAFGSDQMSLSVLPRFQPVWMDSAKTSVSGVTGQAVVIDCVARGHPTPSIRVFKGELRASKLGSDGRGVPDDDSLTLSSITDSREMQASDGVQISNGAVEILSVTSKDKGSYECVASNSVGEIRKIVTLILTGKSPCRRDEISMRS